MVSAEPATGDVVSKVTWFAILLALMSGACGSDHHQTEPRVSDSWPRIRYEPGASIPLLSGEGICVRSTTALLVTSKGFDDVVLGSIELPESEVRVGYRIDQWPPRTSFNSEKVEALSRPDLVVYLDRWEEGLSYPFSYSVRIAGERRPTLVFF